jgi:hypothetical protein
MKETLISTEDTFIFPTALFISKSEISEFGYRPEGYLTILVKAGFHVLVIVHTLFSYPLAFWVHT